jgi:hypothetical protein
MSMRSRRSRPCGRLRRRPARRLSRLLLLALFLAASNLLPGSIRSARAAAPEFVTIRGDQFYLNGQPIKIKGSNYYQRDAPWATMWKVWYGAQVEQEVAAGASRLGLNALRILVPYGTDHQWIIDERGEVNPDSLNELQQMVQLAGKYNLRVILTLFDFYDEWPAAGTPAEAANLRYLDTIVRTFRDDDRVLAWDLHNEPDHYKRWQRDQRPGEVVDWLARMAAATRRLDPNHPLTVGLGDYRNHWAEVGPDRPQIIDFVDFVSFHAYEAPNMLDQAREIKARTGKPILLEEAGWPSAPTYLHPTYNERDQYYVYRRIIDVIQWEGLAGVTQWMMWDYTGGRSLRPSDVSDWMGLFRRDGSLKPAGEAFAEWQVPRLPAQTTSQLPLTGEPTPEEQRPLYFPETDHYVPSYFKELWLQQGGLAMFGLPLTEPFLEERSDRRLTIQIFERAVMEFTLEAKLDPGYDQLPQSEQLRRVVSLRQLGRQFTAGRDFPTVAPFPNTPERWYFPETGHSLAYGFLAYWHGNGGLLQFGQPISEEFVEINPDDGKPYTVQYFERARFEYHPELRGTPYEVQLGALGRQEMARRGWLR